MKVTFRTVQGKTFQIEAEDDTKVGAVKAMIQELQGDDFPKDAMKIIHQGKVLVDDATLKDSNVSESGFCVVMVVKAKKPAAAAPAPAAVAAEPSAAAAPAAAPAAQPPAAAAPEAAPAAAPVPAAAAAAPAAEAAPAAPADPYAAAASELATGSALEEKVAQIMEMGFPRDEVVRAMRAAFNNPERAVEYLMTGIPAGLEPPAPVARVPAAAGGAGAAPAAAGAGAAAPAAPADQPFNMFAPAPGGGAAGGGAGAGGPLAALRSNPQFAALRGLVQQNPALLQPMLQELGKSNPALLNLINSHQAEFLAMINEPIGAGEGDLGALVQQMAAEMGGEGEGEMGGGMEIELTQEEMDAIERLASMGFDRNACIEAFLICDRNEALAANYLLENAGGDMM